MSQAPFNRWPVAQATDWCGDGISTSDAHRFSAKIYGVEWAALTASLVALAQAYSPAAPAAPSGGSDAIPTGP
jgi:hypothetical protein